MLDRDPEAIAEARGDQGAVTRLGVALDAEQRRGRVGRESLDQRPEIGSVEDLARVALDVLRRQLDPRALADALPGVLRVLQPAQLGGRRQLLVVLVADPGLGERRL